MARRRLMLLGVAVVLVSLATLPLLSVTCTVSRDCADGSPISCSGDTCSSGSDNYGWVECDGNRTYCPTQPVCDKDGYCNYDCIDDPDCCFYGAKCTTHDQCGEFGRCSSSTWTCYCT